MTLLVLAIDLPEKVELLNEDQIRNFLHSQGHVLYIYILSFMILAKFWIDHHSQFAHLKATNPTHLWLNILFLMFAALLPFTSDLAGELPTYWLSQFPFHMNMFLISITFLISWQYASNKRKLLQDDVPQNYVRYITKRILVTPLFSIFCMLLAFFKPSFSSLPYLAIPIIQHLFKIFSVDSRGGVDEDS